MLWEEKHGVNYCWDKKKGSCALHLPYILICNNYGPMNRHIDVVYSKECFYRLFLLTRNSLNLEVNVDFKRRLCPSVVVGFKIGYIKSYRSISFVCYAFDAGL